MALSAIETALIKSEVTVAFIQNCPTLRHVFLDGSDTEANNKTAVNTAINTVMDNLFAQAAPTILP